MARKFLLLMLLATSVGAQAQLVQKGRINGVDLAYRWRHPAGKPSELLIRMENMERSDRRVSLQVDLSYQGLTVELLSADTCIKAGAVLNGRVNGLYFRPERLTSDQIRSGDVEVDLTNTAVEETGACP
jgi:hypothetical protein